MRTVEDLIVDLSGRATPVTPLAPPLVRFAQWLAVAAACAIAAVAAFGPRADFGDAIRQPIFIATAALTFAAAAFGGVAALMLAVPGTSRAASVRLASFGLLGAWGLVLVILWLRAGVAFPSDPHWPVCAIRIVGVGVIPAWMLLAMLRGAAPLRPAAAGEMAAIAAMGIAAVATQIACPYDAPSHLIRGHLAPMMLLTILGAWMGPRILNRL